MKKNVEADTKIIELNDEDLSTITGGTDDLNKKRKKRPPHQQENN